MSFKAILAAGAGVLTVSPAFALTNSQIIHHTGGPIPYSELTPPSSSSPGYNARSSGRPRTTSQPGSSVATNTSTSPAANPSAGASGAAGAMARPGSAAPDTSGYNANPAAPAAPGAGANGPAAAPAAPPTPQGPTPSPRDTSNLSGQAPGQTVGGATGPSTPSAPQ